MTKELTKEDKQKNFYSYVRLSTEEQLKGRGKSRQLNMIEAYCKKHVIEIKEEMEDIGKSAYHGDNLKEGAALHKFLEAIKNGSIKDPVLLVESLDRLSRQAVQKAQYQLMQYLEAGIIIVTVSDNMVYKITNNSMEGMMMLMVGMMVGIRSHEESERKSERISHSWKEKIDEARNLKSPLTAMCPKWLKLVGKTKSNPGHYEIIPERAKLIRRICKLISQGVSKQSVANLLNEEGIKPWGRGKQWHGSYIDKIRCSIALIGQYQPHQIVRGKREPIDNIITNYFPRIITNELFTLVSAKKTTYSKPQSPNSSTKSINIKGYFGKTRIQFKNKGIDKRGKNRKELCYYYAVDKFNKSLWSCRHDVLELAVFTAIQAYIKPEDTKLSKMFNVEHESIATKRNQLQTLQVQYTNILDFVTAGELDLDEEIHDKTKALQYKIKIAKKELADLEKKHGSNTFNTKLISKSVKDLSKKEYSRELLQEIVFKVIDYIEVTKDGLSSIKLSNGRSINCMTIQ